MNRYKNTYLDEFPANEEGLLLVNDVALVEALRRRAERKKAEQDAPARRVQLTAEPS